MFEGSLQADITIIFLPATSSPTTSMIPCLAMSEKSSSERFWARVTGSPDNLEPPPDLRAPSAPDALEDPISLAKAASKSSSIVPSDMGLFR